MSRNLLTAALLVMGLSSAAEARVHYVIITALGFFPQVTYVEPGDVVFFKNDAEFTHELSGVGTAEWPWAVTVQPDDWGVVYVTNAAGSAYNSVTAPLEDGVLSFDAPPVEAQAN